MPSVEMFKNITIFFSCSTDYLLDMTDNLQCHINTSNLDEEQTAAIQLIADIMETMNNVLEEKNYKKII